MKIPSSIALIGSLVLAGGAVVGLGFVPGVSWKAVPAPNWKNLAANDWQHVFPAEKKIPVFAAPASVGAALPEAVTFNTHI